MAYLRRCLIGVFAALTFAAPAIPAAQSATVNLRLGHILPQDSPDHRAFVFMADRIKTLTNGEVSRSFRPRSSARSTS